MYAFLFIRSHGSLFYNEQILFYHLFGVGAERLGVNAPKLKFTIST